MTSTDTRAVRVRLHRDVAGIYRTYGLHAMADIEDGIADGLERVDANGAAIDQVERDLVGSWPVDTTDRGDGFVVRDIAGRVLVDTTDSGEREPEAPPAGRFPRPNPPPE